MFVEAELLANQCRKYGLIWGNYAVKTSFLGALVKGHFEIF